jgi:hypothetical protein
MSTTPTVPSLTPSQLNSADPAQWKQLVKQALMDTRCATPAFLAEDMDYTAQTVTVQVAIQERVRTPNGAQWWDIPPIVHVPIVVPRGGGYSVTLPLKKGDEGLLVFCDTCFDNWWVNGQNNSPPAYTSPTAQAVSGSQTQFEVRRHYVHDCGFIPGMWSQPNVLQNYSTTSMQVRADDGQTIIDVSENGVTLQADGTTTVVQLTGSGVSVTAPVMTVANGGTAQVLVTDAFYQYFVTKVLPFLEGLGFTGGPPPTNSETTILKGQ